MPIVPRETQVPESVAGTEMFLSILSKNGLRLSSEQTGLLELYASLLLEWNRKLNLVSRSTSPHSLRFTHLIHSFFPFFFLSLPPGLRVMDLGSGGGLPGIPLAILRPDLRIVLLDSIGKKVNAMESMRASLGLTNVDVMHARAEEIPRRPDRPEPFDLVLARAVAPLADLVRWSLPVVRQRQIAASWRGTSRAAMITLPALIAWKGGELTDELAALKIRTGHDAKTFAVSLPGNEEMQALEKKIVVVELRSEGDRP